MKLTFYIFCSPYFDHHAFIHHALHVLDALLAWNNECSCRMRQSVCQFHFIYLQSPSIESYQNCLVVSIIFLVRVLTFYCLAGFGARVYSVRLPVENCWHVTLSCFIFILVAICFLEVVIAALCVR